MKKQYFLVSYMIKSNGGSRWSGDETVTSSTMFLSALLDTIVSAPNFAGVIRVDPCNKNGEVLQ